ncbi:MAG: hypothetical protein H7331_03865, partial [Bacteroidia bacterium]|nr:hypothetical protein [Bacteroidia bacterium]
MRTIKTALVALTMLSATVHTALAQMNYWTMPPKKFNMTFAMPTGATQGGNGAYSVANAAYDANGATLFYVRDNELTATNGTVIDILPGLGTICNKFYGMLNAQIAIVPIPSTCKQYYVIYAMSNITGGARLLYVKVDASGATPVMTFNGTANVAAYATTCTASNNVPQAFSITGNNSSLLAFAVSKAVSGTGATTKCYLYAVNSTQVAKCEITNTGIRFVNATPVRSLGIISADMEGIEAEISWGNTHFAWTSYNGKVLVATINSTNGDINAGVQSYLLDGATGLEFDNTLTNAPKLYATGSAGLQQIMVSTQAVSSVTTTGYTLTNTFLEYGKNGKIYGISPVFTGRTLTGTNLVGIIPSTNGVTAISTGAGAAMVDSRYLLAAAPNTSPFTLPVQIDGDNYAYANGNLNLTGFTINNLVRTGDCDNGNIRQFCQNGGFAFNPTTLGGTTSQYKFTITPACAAANAINYVGNWVAGQPAANFNLGTLTDAAGKNLTNITDIVTVTYSAKDACGVITTVSYLLNVLAPIPPVMDLRIYSAGVYTPVTATAGSTPANAIAVGTATLGYSTNNSTGTITNRTVIVDEVNSSGGVIYSNIINTGALAYTAGGSGTLFDGLNSYCVSTLKWANYNDPITGNPLTGLPSAACTGGWKGYFAYTNGVPTSYNKIFRITVTLSNACNSVTKVAYVTPTCQGCKFASPTGITQNTITNSNFSVYPNPAVSILNFDWETTTNQTYTLQVTDVLGKVVNTQHIASDQRTG